MKYVAGTFLLLVALGAMSIHSQEVPKPTSEAATTAIRTGAYFTDEDLEHLGWALDALNLRPEDTRYEKKLIDHGHRLSTVDAALDRPLELPAVTEDLNRAFRPSGLGESTMRAAAKYLDLADTRWTKEELAKDIAPLKAFQDAMDKVGVPVEEYDPDNPEHVKRTEKGMELGRQLRDFRYDQVVGGDHQLPFAKDDESKLDARKLTQADAFVTASLSLERQAKPLTPKQMVAVASLLPNLMFDSTLPIPASDAVPATKEALDFAAQFELAAAFVAAERCQRQFEWLVAHYRPQLLLRPDDFKGEHTLAGVTGGVVACVEGPYGRFVVGGTGPNTYTGDDFIAIIDLGGDDVYRGRVASANAITGSPLSFVLDLSGDDRYVGDDYTQGFGLFGVGLLYDLGGGNDSYSARNAAQGCGMCGVGVLYDDGGDDHFRGDTCVQGAGVYGYGRLDNTAGNDVYRAALFAQGFAQVHGLGVLNDAQGNDQYIAGDKYNHAPLLPDHYQSLSQGFSIGNRRGVETGGGIGLLIDQGWGNDTYSADVYGQGAAYWYALGALVDEGGNDTYTLGQYGQGGGIHLAAGILVDLAGDDTYTNPRGVGIGGAHDWSVGWLIDRDGNDIYTGNGQGQGLNFSVGILLDCFGDDLHVSSSQGNMGNGTNNSIGALLDLGGRDTYTEKGTENRRITTRGNQGVCYDIRAGWFRGIDESTLPTPQKPAPTKTTVQHILISWDAVEVVTLKNGPRTKDEAEALVKQVLRKARTKDADWKALQTKYNEDSGVNESNTYNEYEVTAEARLVAPFKELGLILGVGQIGVCETQYGYHIIKRVK